MAVRGDIRDALAAVVEGLSLAGATVRKRKLPALVEGETPPVVCVSVGDARFEPATAHADAAWYGFYVAAVTVVTKTGMKLADGATDEDWADEIRRAVTFPALNAAGAARVDDCDPTRQLPFDPALIDSTLNWTALGFLIRTLEPR